MTKLNCAILDDYSNSALTMANWDSLSDRINLRVYTQHFNSEELISKIKDCEIVMAMRERSLFDRNVLAQLPNLKLLLTSGMRNAAIDLTVAAERGILVCGTQTLKEAPTELTWALILALARGIPQEYFRFHNTNEWISPLGMDLHGKTLGLLGLGQIGTQMAHIAKSFGMQVLAWSQNLTAEKAAEVGVQFAGSKEALLKNSDIISIHVKLSDRTRGLIGADEFKLMKKTALLINTARAAIVDQNAMIAALKQGLIRGAGVDVLEVEPPPENCPLRNIPNLLVTSHIGYVTEMNYRTYFSETVENLEAFLQGKPLRIIN